MKVLAIGATGFIGRHVLSLLVDHGLEISVLHRGVTVPSLPEGVREIRANRNQLANCRSELQQFAPDVILDLILYTEQQARELVNTFRGSGARVVAVSSADVYRNYDGFRGKATAAPDPPPLREDAPLRETRYPYRGHDLPFVYAHDYEKMLIEQVVLCDQEFPATVLRLPAVYGPGDKQHRLKPYLQRMSGSKVPILLEEGKANWRWTRGFVENIAAALALAVEDPRGVGHVYNVGDDPTLTEREWVDRIAALSGWDSEVLTVPQAELPHDDRQSEDWRYHLWIDTSALRAELGYVPPVPFDEGLRRTVEWEYSLLNATVR